MASKSLAMQHLRDQAAKRDQASRSSTDDRLLGAVGGQSSSSNGAAASGPVAKLGSTLLRARGASMPGLTALPGALPSSGSGSPGSESPTSGLSPKPPSGGQPSRGGSGPRSHSILNPDRSGVGSSREGERLGSSGGLGFDPLDPSLPSWVPQVFERLARLEGGGRGGLSLPESVALGSRLQALEDAVRQTQMSYRTMQATVAEHTNMLYRQDRRGSYNGNREKEKEARDSTTGGATHEEFAGLDKRLASMEVLLSSCSARLEDHDAQVLELGLKLQLHKEASKAQDSSSSSQLQQQDTQIQEQLQVLKRKAEETEQKLAALDAKVASAAAAAAAGATGTSGMQLASASAVAEGTTASGGGDAGELAKKVALLEQQLVSTSSTAIDANSAVAMFNIRLDTYDQSISGSQSALQLLATKLTEFNSELYVLKDRVNQTAMEASAAAAAALSSTMKGGPRRSLSGTTTLPGSGGGGGGGLAADAAALRDLEYRFNKRLNEVEAYVRKNGGTLSSTPASGNMQSSNLSGTGGHSTPPALPPVMESDDSYSSHQVAAPKPRFAPDLEGGQGKLADRADLSKAVVSAAKALQEASKATSDVASLSQELQMMKAALRMLHEQAAKQAAAADDGSGGGGGASNEAVTAAAEAAAKAQKKADALEVIAKNFAMRLDALADQNRVTAQVAEHAKEAATAAGLMGGAWGAAPHGHAPPGYGSPGRGVRFAEEGAPPGPPVHMPVDPNQMQDIRRLAAQQMEMLTRFQKIERDLMGSLMAYTKKTDLKDLENFVMDKHQQLQQELEEVRISVGKAHVTAMTSNIAAAAIANGGRPSAVMGGGGGGGMPQGIASASAADSQGSLMQRAQAVARNLAHSQSMAVARRSAAGAPGVGGDVAGGSPRKVRI